MSPVERVLAGAIVVPFVIGFSTADAGPGGGTEVCRFQDPQIVESSGLVVRDGLMATVNDSGDSGRVFVVDADSCRTVGTTSWSEEAEDIEAIAPAGRDGADVLVGDIGDNLTARGSVRLLRVPVGRVQQTVTPTTYEITDPDGPRDAEALLVHPRTGRVYIASKGLMAGILYAAPSTLSEDGDNRMTELADVPGMVTDGAFFPDGRHFVLRTYSRAVFYSFPGLEAVGEVDLPDQQQGEGIAVDERGRVHLSSEGLEAPVLRLDLPRRLEQALAPPGPPPDDDGATPTDGGTDAGQEPARDAWPWLLGAAFGLVMIVVLLRALRPR
jgi:hypothetical protein